MSFRAIYVYFKYLFGPNKDIDQKTVPAPLCVCACTPTSQTASLSPVSVSLAFPVVRLPPKSILVAFLQLLADKLAGGR